MNSTVFWNDWAFERPANSEKIPVTIGGAGETMTLWKPLAGLFAALALAACGGGSGSPGTGDEVPVELCVASDCGELIVLATVPDAENLLFTPDGRLFVSGGTNVFEVVRTGDTTVELTPLSPTDCNFTGLALRGDTLYASCGSGELYAAALDAEPELAPIHTYENTALPNGMATGADGALYVTDGPLPGNGSLPSPKIIRLRFAENDPIQVVEQITWLDDGLAFPNGLVRRGNLLYFTDSSILPVELGAVRSVPILPDGSAGDVVTVATFASLLDDLTSVGDRLIVTGYLSGRIVLLGPDGVEISGTALGGLSFPSSVIVGQPPMFRPDELLITEKGILGDTASGVGNRLTLLRPNPS